MATDKLQAGSVASLTSKIKTLVAGIARNSKVLREDRLKAGHLLVALRNKFTQKDGKGRTVRTAKGTYTGTFVAHLKANGIPVCTAYMYMGLVTGKAYAANPSRAKYWVKLNHQMKKSTPEQKVALLKRAVAHICKLYGVKADVIVRAK